MNGDEQVENAKLLPMQKCKNNNYGMYKQGTGKTMKYNTVSISCPRNDMSERAGGK